MNEDFIEVMCIRDHPYRFENGMTYKVKLMSPVIKNDSSGVTGERIGKRYNVLNVSTRTWHNFYENHEFSVSIFDSFFVETIQSKRKRKIEVILKDLADGEQV